MLTNSEDPDQTLHYAVSDQGLHCSHMSHKKDARLIWINGELCRYWKNILTMI